VRHDDDERIERAVGDQIVKDHVGLHAVGPDVLIAAGAMQEVKNRVAIGAGVVARRKVNESLARLVDRFRLIFEPLHDTVRDITHLLPRGNVGVLDLAARRERAQNRQESQRSERSEFQCVFLPVALASSVEGRFGSHLTRWGWGNDRPKKQQEYSHNLPAGRSPAFLADNTARYRTYTNTAKAPPPPANFNTRTSNGSTMRT
jgi:hypothetical protein